MKSKQNKTKTPPRASLNSKIATMERQIAELQNAHNALNSRVEVSLVNGFTTHKMLSELFPTLVFDWSEKYRAEKLAETNAKRAEMGLPPIEDNVSVTTDESVKEDVQRGVESVPADVESIPEVLEDETASRQKDSVSFDKFPVAE